MPRRSFALAAHKASDRGLCPFERLLTLYGSAALDALRNGRQWEHFDRRAVEDESRVPPVLILHRDPLEPERVDQRIAEGDPEGLELHRLVRTNPVVPKDRVEQAELPGERVV